MVDWLISNKDWLFSGAGIAIITLIGGMLIKRRKDSSNVQRKKTEYNSKGIKVRGDVNITNIQREELTTSSKEKQQTHADNLPFEEKYSKKHKEQKLLSKSQDNNYLDEISSVEFP